MKQPNKEAKDKESNYVRKIVTIENEQEVSLVKEAILASGGRIIKELPVVNAYLCEFPTESNVSLAFRSLSTNAVVEEDIKFKLCFLPFMFPQKKQYEQRIDWGLKRIGAPKVWDKLKKENKNRVSVGIIDTGIDFRHPDLRGNIKGGISTIDGFSSVYDDYGHGTHVAGIIGAYSRNGVAGINPYVDFHVVKAFDKKGQANLSDIIEGMDWLIRRQVSIINMSFSTSETSQTLVKLIKTAYDKGIILVAAAGNDGGKNSVNYPARFREVIAVSATDNNDKIASFSSTGPEIDFCAPGDKIYSTWAYGGYKVSSGTSFAAPHISGTVSDIINYYGPVSPTQIRDILHRGCVPLQNLTKDQQGAGLVEIPRIIK